MKDALRKIALYTCAYYTVTVFFVMLLYLIVNRDLSKGVKPSALALMLPFALLFATANHVYRHAPWGRFPRVLLHFALTVGGTFAFLYLPNREGGDAGQAGILLLVFTAIYVAVMGTVLLIGARVRRVTRDESEYQSVYKK